MRNGEEGGEGRGESEEERGVRNGGVCGFAALVLRAYNAAPRLGRGGGRVAAVEMESWKLGHGSAGMETQEWRWRSGDEGVGIEEI